MVKESWDDSVLPLQLNYTLPCKFAFLRRKSLYYNFLPIK